MKNGGMMKFAAVFFLKKFTLMAVLACNRKIVTSRYLKM